MTTKLPSRADHVGSFLRPREVIEAREHRAADNISYDDLRAAEDAAIADLVTWQESLGLKAITDGEFRRYFFHTDFLLQLAGVEERGGLNKAFKNDSGKDVSFARRLHRQGRDPFALDAAFPRRPLGHPCGCLPDHG